MSLLAYQVYASTNDPLWLAANGSTSNGQFVNQLNVVNGTKTLEERLFVNTSNCGIQVNTLTNGGNTRNFRMGVNFNPDFSTVPTLNSMVFDIGNVFPAMVINQSNVTFSQAIVLDTISNVSNFVITQSSTSTILSNGSSVMALTNSGGILLSPSTSISNSGATNVTTASNIVLSNASSAGNITMSGSDLVIGIGAGSNNLDALHFISNAAFRGTIVYNDFGWNPDLNQYVYTQGITDPDPCNISNLPAWRVTLSNTSNGAYNIPLACGFDTTFIQNKLQVNNLGNSSNFATIVGNSLSMTYGSSNRYFNEFLSSIDSTVCFDVGTISPLSNARAMVIQTNGIVSFPVGVDIATFSNSPTSSNSIGGVTLSNGSVVASPSAISYLGQLSIYSNLIYGQGGIDLKLNSNVTITTGGNIYNPSNTSNLIGGVVLSNDKIIGNGTATAASKGFYINQAIANTVVYYIIQYNIGGNRGVTVPLFGSLTYQNITGYAWGADAIVGFMLPPYTMIEGYYGSLGTSNYSYSNATAFATYANTAVVNLADSNWYFRVSPIPYF